MLKNQTKTQSLTRKSVKEQKQDNLRCKSGNLGMLLKDLIGFP